MNDTTRATHVANATLLALGAGAVAAAQATDGKLAIAGFLHDHPAWQRLTSPRCIEVDPSGSYRLR